jgi:hypothetical protein
VVCKISENQSPNFGFDVRAEEYGDLMQAGIVYPVAAWAAWRHGLLGLDGALSM